MSSAKRFSQNPGNSAICYYRYSSDAQRDASIDQQQQAAREYAEGHNLSIIKEYADRAVSGTRDDRVQYTLMLYEVELLRPAYLILWKTDRLSRDKFDSVKAKARLRECGVKIVYVAEAVPDDDEATQVLLESIFEGLAASFISSHRRNVLRGMTYNAERCLYNGIQILGYTGKPEARYEVDPATAPVVQFIYEKYAGGMPMQRICQLLKKQGMKSIRGADFSINSLRRILTNAAYVGIYKWGDYEIQGGMPAIVSEDLFRRVQERLQAHSRGGKGTDREAVKNGSVADYWLSGAVFCGNCGAPLQGISGTSKSGRTHFYYACSNHRKKCCSLKNKRKDDLEDVVLYILRQIASEPANRLILAQHCYEAYKHSHEDRSAYTASVEAQMRETQNKLDNLLHAIEAGIITETTKARMTELEETKARLRDTLTAEQQRRMYDLTLHDITKWLEMFAGNPDNAIQREEMLRDYVKQIFVYDDRLLVLFRYTGKEKEYLFHDSLDIVRNQQKIRDILDHKSDSVFSLTGCSTAVTPGLPIRNYTITCAVIDGCVGIMAVML